jgi:predicted DsbA family dithiol-disulfide isomerase
MSEQQGREEIVIYSDYVCPFCYLGRASLDQYQDTREDRLEIDWRPFDLRNQQRREDGTIDHGVDTGKDEEYFEQAKEGVRRLQKKYDVEMDLEIATDIDSLPAQVVSYELKGREDYETWLAFDEGVFEALWREGRDIGDADVLADIAADAGVDPETVEEILADEAARTAVHEQFRQAQQQGITGVPTFAYDGYAARGAVPPEQLERLVDGT